VLAALRVFSSGSYAGSTTAEIAREAGVSEPVLYRHFPSKRDLWAACLDAAWDDAPANVRPFAAISMRAHMEKLREEGLVP